MRRESAAGHAFAEAGSEASQRNSLSGTVEAVSFVGSMTRIVAKLEDGTALTAKVVSGQAATRFRPGDRVGLSWDVADAV